MCSSKANTTSFLRSQMLQIKADIQTSLKISYLEFYIKNLKSVKSFQSVRLFASLNFKQNKQSEYCLSPIIIQLFNLYFQQNQRESIQNQTSSLLTIFEVMYLIQNNMKKHYQSECSLQLKTYQIHKLTQQQQRITKITQKFASINKQLLEKTQLETTTSHEHTTATSKLTLLEHKIDVSIRTCEQNIAKYKDRLQSVKQSQAKMENSFRQKLNHNKQRLKNMKLKFISNIFECRYKHEQMIVEVHEQFQKILQKTYQNKYLFDQKILQKNGVKLKTKFNNQLEELKSISLNIQNQESKSKEAIVSELQAKLKQLKEKLKKNESFLQQTLSNVKQKTELMKQEFQAQLNEEKAIREQNKEKLLTLFQTNMANSLDKSLK